MADLPVGRPGRIGADRPLGRGLEEREQWIEGLARLLDRAIPLGRRYGIGLDAVLGLIPGIGDVAGGLLSGAIIWHAHQGGVPRSTLLRMLANVGIDAALGSVPFVGDLFDVAWQANTKNLELYRSALRGERRAGKDYGFLALVLLALGVIVAIPILMLVWVTSRLF